jgi:NADH-quinone oxidoreductase subunit J
MSVGAVNTLILLLGAVAIVGAVKMLASHHPVHSALYLVLSFAATAGIYLALGAPFIAIIQVAVYAGAIMVLFLFIMMYLNLGLSRDILDSVRRRTVLFWTAGLLGVGVLLATVLHGSGPAITAGSASTAVEDIGVTLIKTYGLPFELASVLLLAAMVGALVIARPALNREAGDKEEAQP